MVTPMTAFLLLTLPLLGQPPAPAVRFERTKEGTRVIAYLPPRFADTLAGGVLKQEQGEEVLTVAIVDDETKKAGPAMLGKYERDKALLTFTPRFPLISGTTYQAKLDHPLLGQVSVSYRMPELKNQS